MIRIVTALAAEARPIVSRFRLQPDGDGPFRLYRGDQVELVVSGIGSSAAAAAVGYLAGAGAGRASAWLNVGIGGHRDATLGTPRLANKIVAAGGARAWYPPAVFEPPCGEGAVQTVDGVESGFAGEAVYEMEAAGFYPAALRFATAEAIQVLKVVSDNRATGTEHLNGAKVEELIERNLPVIDGLVTELREIAEFLDRRSAPPPALAEIDQRWRFTVTQRRQLERLLRRLATLDPDRPVELDELAGAASSRAVLERLRSRL